MKTALRFATLLSLAIFGPATAQSPYPSSIPNIKNGYAIPNSAPKITSEFDDGGFLSTQLKCPSNNSGIMDHIQKRSDSVVRRNRYKVENDKIVKVIFEMAKPGRGFEVIGAYDVERPVDAAQKAASRIAVSGAMPLYVKVCSDPIGLRQFNDEAKENTKALLSETEADSNLIKETVTAVEKTKKPFRAVGVKCPEANDNILEAYRKNDDGITARLRFKLAAGDIYSYIIEAALPGRDYVILTTFSRSATYNKPDMDNHRESINQAMPLVTQVCKDRGHSMRFEALMKQNREKLSKWADRSPPIPLRTFHMH